MRRAHLVLTPCFGKAVRFGFSIAVPLRFFAVFALVAYYLESLFPELLRSVCRGRPSTKRLVGLGTRSFLWVIDPVFPPPLLMSRLGTRTFLWVIYVRQDGCPS